MPLGFFSHVPCSSSRPAACAAFPDAGSLAVFRSLGVCLSASLVTWVGFQPFPSFSMLLLLRLLAGVAGVVHPVSGCSRYGDVSLVWGEVTLLPFPYFRVGVLLACGSSGIRGSSRLWVRGRINGLLCLWPPGIDHLSQVRRCSSSVPDRYVASPPLVGFAFGLSAVPLPQAAAVGFGLCGSTRLSSLLRGRC